MFNKRVYNGNLFFLIIGHRWKTHDNYCYRQREEATECQSGIITLKKTEEWILNEIPEKKKLLNQVDVKRDGKYLGPVSVLKVMYELNTSS